jgi:hypothetical protein
MVNHAWIMNLYLYKSLIDMKTEGEAIVKEERGIWLLEDVTD